MKASHNGSNAIGHWLCLHLFLLILISETNESWPDQGWISELAAPFHIQLSLRIDCIAWIQLLSLTC